MTISYQPGRYRCLVTEQAFQESRSRKPMIVLKVRPESQLYERIGNDGELFIDEEPTSQQYPRTVRLVIVEDKPESLDYAMRKLRHAGFAGSSFDELDLVGKEVTCECKHDTYEGKFVEQWELPLPQSESKPLESDSNLTRKLNAIFGKRLTNGGIATPPQQQQQRTAAAGAAEDDDIPF